MNQQIALGLEFIEEPEDIVGFRGFPGEFKCRVNSDYGDPEVSWFKNDEPLVEFNRRSFVDANGTLVFRALTKTSEGQYQCYVKNRAGIIVSKTAQLSVIG